MKNSALRVTTIFGAASLAIGLMGRPCQALNGMALTTTLTVSNPWSFPDEVQQYSMGKLMVKYMSDGTTNTLVEDTTVFGPCFSPDGRQVAYCTGEPIDQIPQAIYIRNIDGTGETKVCDCGGEGTKEVYCNWTDDGYIWWSQCDNAIYRVRANGTGKETVWTSSDPKHALGVACDNAQNMTITYPKDGNEMVWWTGVFTVASEDWREFGFGCSGTIRPDGLKIAQNYQHSTIWIKDINQTNVDEFETEIDPPGDAIWVIKWAKHDPDFMMVSVEPAPFEVYVYQFSTDAFTLVSSGPATGWDFYPEEFTSPTPVNKNPALTRPGSSTIGLSQASGIVTAGITVPGVKTISLLAANGSLIQKRQVAGAGTIALNSKPLVTGVYFVKTTLADNTSLLSSIQVCR